MKTDTKELLLFIYKNAEMGKSSIPYIWEKSNNSSLKKELEDALKEYTEIYSRAELLLLECGDIDPKGLSVAEKLMSDIMIRINAMVTPTAENYADMIRKGAEMGAKDISEQMSHCPEASSKATTLAEQLKRCNKDVAKRMEKLANTVK